MPVHRGPTQCLPLKVALNAAGATTLPTPEMAPGPASEVLAIGARTMGLPNSRVDEMPATVSLTDSEAGRRLRVRSHGDPAVYGKHDSCDVRSLAGSQEQNSGGHLRWCGEPAQGDCGSEFGPLALRNRGNHSCVSVWGNGRSP